MFQFGNPSFLLLLIVLGTAGWRVYGRHRKAGIRFAPTHRLPPQSASWRNWLRLILPALGILGMALVVVGLARPQTILSTSRRTADVIAIQMVVDISGSMEALDLSTQTPTGPKYRTRLDVVKETFAEFVERRETDLIGLVAFGGFASTLVPLTTDHNVLLHVLEGVESPTPAFGKNGAILNEEELLTAIGDGLATACARLRDSEPTSRIVVLLSDGESNAGLIEPEKAVKVAKALGIKVYTIGVGSTGRAPFWGTDRRGRKVISHSHVTLDETQLRRIAEETSGRYFNVQSAKGLEAAMDDIDTLEKTRIEHAVYHQFNELFPWFVLPGLAIITLSAAISMAISRRIM